MFVVQNDGIIPLMSYMQSSWNMWIEILHDLVCSR